MEAVLATVSLTLCFISNGFDAVPPPQCFANFRWDDCGTKPVPVMYYWRLGSRCEVGMWKGCLPNVNMFKDEYECVSTCIFAVRALPPDWHRLEEEDKTTLGVDTTTAEPDAVTDSAATTEGSDGGGGGSSSNSTTKTEVSVSGPGGSSTESPAMTSTTSTTTSEAPVNPGDPDSDKNN
ncbi:unnamed protein product [Chrysodeixis includens]|uniref:BPTI/Kunitz inhibitor domain-containing protein n=1 Tax=Chrysodeixis includens TaxID=689277 RepID=A0A9N8PYQ5_CHRIL|nr:unnamed protein product [Chrysodeixis includens]